VTIASKEKQIERIKTTLVKPEDAPQAIHFHLKADALTANEVVVCKDLSKRFGGREIFKNLNLMIRRDEKVCLLGANGCGKTTLLKILTNKIEPDSGSYKLGSNVHVGYYEQGTVRPNDPRTMLESLNATFPRYDTKQLRNMLGSFLFRGDDVFKRMSDLSGGEFARIQLLKLMLNGSNVLFLDEPTNHLDLYYQLELLDRIAEWTENGNHAAIGVFHDLNLASRFSHRLILIDEGRIVDEGTPRAVLGGPELRRVYRMDVAASMRSLLQNW